jgi:hypothetical protein
MNKNIKLAVAGAVLALSASADAGIIIPAGDWTLDISGNVNTYLTQSRYTGSTVAGGLTAAANDTGTKSQGSITTGLLPNFLSVAGSTRQNDLDVTFLISINPGGPSAAPLAGGSDNENRQAFMTFGDKSWGSIKIGKDLGIFASDAILNDMTLLGVGSGAGSRTSSTTSLGRIGTGFVYADWKTQVAYTTPNFNGFQATVGITQAWGTTGNTTTDSLVSTRRAGAGYAYEGKASYSFSGSDLTGKVWVGGFGQRVEASTDTAYAGEIGANLNVAGLGLTGYYYSGQGIGLTAMLRDGYDVSAKARDSDGGYVQATYILPTKTKIGASWGRSNLDKNASGDTAAANFVKEQEMWTIGAYHPLTKHLNIVAEYNDAQDTGNNNVEQKARTIALGGLLFF